MSRPVVIRHIAFFDVDETLITAKSLLDFAQRVPHGLWEDETGQPIERLRSGEIDLAALQRSGASRAEMNRAYYRRYAGVPLERLQKAGRDWYHAYRMRPDGYITAGLAALARHRRAGHMIVLISGSARPLLTPLSEDLGADRILCTEQLDDAQGVLTGEVAHPMVGEAKAEAVTEVMAQLRVPTTDCFAYGDHGSDLDMLQAVGSPVVVGTDPVLARHAQASNWPMLPADAGPRIARAQHHDTSAQYGPQVIALASGRGAAPRRQERW
ncbi:HAD family phosphatase [Streptomyces sp. NRRL S-31]|uniref:HAD family hydrolase n=1 Tax=Streptomyces sp. NRRL S-31 TaxID=1463898 RepID=UPI000A7D2469|nr:HAD family hydrolase [Streptomyces sp. NRRL S-31]